VAPADPRQDFDAGCVWQRRHYDHRLDDWDWTVWVYAADPMVWVGLIQAYLLMSIIAVLLVLGSDHTKSRKWHVVGALAHCVPLIAALSSLDVFASIERSKLSE
jgi:hypothetical protein